MTTRHNAGLWISSILFFGAMIWYVLTMYYPLVVYMSPNLSIDSEGLPIVSQISTLMMLALLLFGPLYFMAFWSLILYQVISGNEIIK